ncbi:MAG TPA: lipocalin family protein [Candidatus Avelusimicrobium excrementipullorum]|nr:lipocalin family protein [Candidatus Avelusimicrobium excrementipullorum]
MKKLVTTLSAAVLLAACGGPSLEGNWVQPVPGLEGQTQGMSLQTGGAASSLNMATLLYESWSVSGNTLTLTGTSVGNGQTIEFTQTYTFSMPDENTLILTGENGGTQSFTRQK